MRIINSAAAMSVVAIGVSLISGPVFGTGEERIVSLGGAITEIIYALDAGESIVAVDASSTFPADVQSKQRVGYYRMLSTEGVLAQQPDLVLASVGAGPPEVLKMIRDANIRFETIPFSSTLESALQRILDVGRVLSREESAKALHDKIEAEINSLSVEQADPSRILFIYARGAGALNISGQGTAADEMIRLAGGENAIKEFNGYRPLTSEAAVSAQPDIILLTSHGLASLGGIDGVLSVPGLKATPAGRERKIVAMDDLLLLSMGPRIAEAVSELKDLLGE